jgi:hypothetical protein
LKRKEKTPGKCNRQIRKDATMDQPTREEFEQLKEEVRKLREQQTEPIQLTVERRYPDKELLQEISRKQDEHFNYLKGELESILTKQNEHAKGLISHSRSISTLQIEMKGARADILAIKESQADFRDKLETMATKDDLRTLHARIDDKMTAMESRLIEAMKSLLQQKSSE